MKDLIETLKQFEFFIYSTKSLFGYEKNVLAEHWTRIRAVIEETTDKIIPFEIEFQPSSHCNLNCKHCIGGDCRPAVRQFISEKVMEKVIKEFAEFNRRNSANKIVRIRFSGLFGEPLVNKKSTLLGIRLALENGMEVGLFSNGIAIDKEVCEAILGAVFINVSLDSASEQSFKKIKGKTGFERIMRNLAMLVKKRDESVSNLNVTVSFVLQKDNCNEIYELSNRLKSIGVDILRINMNLNYGDKDTELAQEQIDNAFNQIKKAKDDFEDNRFKILARYSEEEVVEGAKKPSFKKCYFGYLMSVVACDSTMYVCDHYAKAAHRDKLKYGDLSRNNTTLLDTTKVAKEKLDLLNPSRECQVCPCMAERINTLMDFLDKSHRKYPRFLDYIERKYILQLKLDYAMSYSTSQKTNRLLCDTISLFKKHENENIINFMVENAKDRGACLVN